MKLLWTFRARQDLKETARFIAKDKPQTARKFVARLQSRARRAARFPQAGRMVPEFNQADLREVIEGNYRIVYPVARRSLHILTVFEGHRLLPRQVITEPDEG